MKNNINKKFYSPCLLGMNKPKGIICSHKDEKGRQSIYDIIPKRITKYINGNLHSVGRLDYNTQGLILLTNNSKIKYYLESPSNKIIRVYKVKVQGVLKEFHIENIRKGLIIKGIKYSVLSISVIKNTRTYTWIIMKLNQGKNQHIRKVFFKLGFSVNKLIRIKYGPFKLASLELGNVRQLNLKKLNIKNEINNWKL